jgi:hypothetical protein
MDECLRLWHIEPFGMNFSMALMIFLWRMSTAVYTEFAVIVLTSGLGTLLIENLIQVKACTFSTGDYTPFDTTLSDTNI